MCFAVRPLILIVTTIISTNAFGANVLTTRYSGTDDRVPWVAIAASTDCTRSHCAVTVTRMDSADERWSMPSRLYATSPDRITATDPLISTNGSNRWLIGWTAASSDGWDIHLAESMDAGHTWSTARIRGVGYCGDTVTLNTLVYMDDFARWLAVFEVCKTGLDASPVLYSIASGTGHGTWTGPVLIHQPAESKVTRRRRPEPISVEVDDTVRVSWCVASEGTDVQVCVAESDTGGMTWSVNTYIWDIQDLPFATRRMKDTPSSAEETHEAESRRDIALGGVLAFYMLAGTATGLRIAWRRPERPRL